MRSARAREAHTRGRDTRTREGGKKRGGKKNLKKELCARPKYGWFIEYFSPLSSTKEKMSELALHAKAHTSLCRCDAVGGGGGTLRGRMCTRNKSVLLFRLPQLLCLAASVRGMHNRNECVVEWTLVFSSFRSRWWACWLEASLGLSLKPTLPDSLTDK